MTYAAYSNGGLLVGLRAQRHSFIGHAWDHAVPNPMGCHLAPVAAFRLTPVARLPRNAAMLSHWSA